MDSHDLLEYPRYCLHTFKSRKGFAFHRSEKESFRVIPLHKNKGEPTYPRKVSSNYQYISHITVTLKKKKTLMLLLWGSKFCNFVSVCE